MQMSSSVGVAAVTRSLIARQGLKGFATGMGSALALDIPSSAAYSALYVHLRDDIAQQVTKENLRFAPAVAAFVSRAVITLVFTPLEVARLQLQASETKVEGGLREAMRRVMQMPPGGIRALYRGGLLSVLRDAPHSAAYWAGFGLFKGPMRELRVGRADEAATVVEEKKSSLPEDLIAATLSGAVATVVTQPFDVLKTRKQVRTAATHGPKLRREAGKTQPTRLGPSISTTYHCSHSAFLFMHQPSLRPDWFASHHGARLEAPLHNVFWKRRPFYRAGYSYGGRAAIGCNIYAPL